LASTDTSSDVPIICHDDDEAKAEAGRVVDGHDVELWNGSRFVINNKPK
jgi:hypothetical protein